MGEAGWMRWNEIEGAPFCFLGFRKRHRSEPVGSHAAMITEMLDGNFPPMPYLNTDVSPLTPDAMRGMKAAWDAWATTAMSELDRVLSQMHTYGASLTTALQPQHTENERDNILSFLAFFCLSRHLHVHHHHNPPHVQGAARCRRLPRVRSCDGQCVHPARSDRPGYANHAREFCCLLARDRRSRMETQSGSERPAQQRSASRVPPQRPAEHAAVNNTHKKQKTQAKNP